MLNFRRNTVGEISYPFNVLFPVKQSVLWKLNDMLKGQLWERKAKNKTIFNTKT